MTRHIRRAIRAFDRHTLRTMNPGRFEIDSRPRRLI